MEHFYEAPTFEFVALGQTGDIMLSLSPVGTSSASIKSMQSVNESW